MTTKNPRPRGRPRRFDPEQAIAVSQRLFHAKGYDAVSVADITDTLGINPPSFYAAFGNKAALFARVLEQYAVTDAIPLAALLRTDRPVAECLTNVLEDAARRYGAHPETTGCLALEGLHANDPGAREAARAANIAAEDLVRSYIAARHPDVADRVTDFVCTTLVGMSAKARVGHGVARLLATARLAGLAVAQIVADEAVAASPDVG
ncbi:helix-turn-helix domain containing protein [Stenotrophomonas sp. HITSZ_GD]|uniref:TetR/AcrR family transcriptional regulator n=1 Tax=Stenotrophomonas sp. HITSZ_GD TaxID=3037248 RepID=UPI00240E5886|nr:TetR/AcrR family transcriptional regulator [Stenotrophomonas sp. HITSZ_GD]MDG2524238.1 helix-turn-helix domain containing protein [Stenotrophomonas sp. HITSZ_GD]